MVSFTGSTATGRAIMAAAAPTLKRVFLELGGKSAAIVLDDADVAAVAGATAFAACIHAGQGCAITTRLVVPREKYDEAVQVAAATMESIGARDPGDPGAICGPVISQAQRDRVESYLRLAVEEGGTFATGGHVIEPGRLLDRARPSWPASTTPRRLAQEEIFGPVLVVIPHDGDDDAVRIANESAYGLSGSVDSADLERAKAVARRIRTGTLAVNGGVWFSPDAPFGGYKQSGIGREMGVAGFEEYLETKTMRGAGMRGSRTRSRSSPARRRGSARRTPGRWPPRARRSWWPTSTTRRARRWPRTSGGGGRCSCAPTCRRPSRRPRWPRRPWRRTAGSTCSSTTPRSTATCSSTC